MKKTNLQIELECSENWLQNYNDIGVVSSDYYNEHLHKVDAMRAHVRDLRRRIAGKIDA